MTAASGTRVTKAVDTAEQAVRLLEEILEMLQTAQGSIPAPTLKEVEEIRQGKRPLTREAYLLGTFQRAILAAENVASDLRAVDLETLREVHQLRLSGLEMNAIEEAVAERRTLKSGGR